MYVTDWDKNIAGVMRAVENYIIRNFMICRFTGKKKISLA